MKTKLFHISFIQPQERTDGVKGGTTPRAPRSLMGGSENS